MALSKGGRRDLEEALETLICVLAVIVGALVLAWLMGGCAAYPRTLASSPLTSVIEPLAVSWELEEGPGDEKVVPVKVGELRLALATAERYEGAVESQNLAVEQVGVMARAYEARDKDVRVAVEAGIWNTGVGVVGGFVGGVAVAAIILGLLR